MTTCKRNTKLSVLEAVAGDRDPMKALMKEALQDVLGCRDGLCEQPRRNQPIT